MAVGLPCSCEFTSCVLAPLTVNETPKNGSHRCPSERRNHSGGYRSTSVLLYDHRDRKDHDGRGSPGRSPPFSHRLLSSDVSGGETDDELMLNVLRCQLTY